MPADQERAARVSRGGRTLLAAVAVWVLYRLAKHAVKVALVVGVLAGAAHLAAIRGVDLSAVGRFATCEIPALIHGAGQLQVLAQSARPASADRLRLHASSPAARRPARRRAAQDAGHDAPPSRPR